jgi:glycosyltransferase involved in cell wall biosynthesis
LAASDCVVAVSDFVAQRQLRIGLVPPNRVVRIYNSVTIPESTQPEQRAALKRELGIAEDRPLIACACRATPEKGVAHLLKAFDIAARKLLEKTRPALVYIGEGPFLPKLRHLRETLSSQNDIFLVGYKPDAASLLEGADICVVPSVWQEAFGLAVAEPMARGKAVIASRVGAIPELIENGISGLLVEPGDEQSLSSALVNLLENPDRASALGKGAKLRIASMFTLEKKLASLLPLIEGGFSHP